MKEEKNVLDSSLYIEQITQITNAIVSLVEERSLTEENILECETSLNELQKQLIELQNQIQMRRQEIKLGKVKIKSINVNLLKNKRFNKKLSRAFIGQKKVSMKKYTK